MDKGRIHDREPNHTSEKLVRGEGAEEGRNSSRATGALECFWELWSSYLFIQYTGLLMRDVFARRKCTKDTRLADQAPYVSL